MQIRAIDVIFQDVDGCLNAPDGAPLPVGPHANLSEGQISILSEISQALDASSVKHLVINTGRFWPILKTIVDAIPSRKLRYCVMEHACVVYDREADIYLDLPAMAAEFGLTDLFERFQQLDDIRALMQWYDRVGQGVLEAIYGEPMPRLDKQANLSFAIPKGVDGDVVLQKTEACIRNDFDAADPDGFEYSRSDKFIDILPGIHKMDGIELMCAFLDVSAQDCLAVGDYLNDLSVFQSNMPVLCPSNAHPTIQQLTRDKGDRGELSDQPYALALLQYLRRVRKA